MSDAHMKSTERPAAPYDTASMVSRYTFHFVNDLIRRGAKKELEDADLSALAKHDRVVKLTDAFEREWAREKERKGSQANLWCVMYRVFTYPFWISAMWCFLESVTRIAQPVLLGFFLEWLTGDDAEDVLIGLVWAGSISIVAFIQAIIHHQLYFYTMRGGWNARMAFSGLIHRKVLRLHSAAVADAGKVANLISNDVMRFDNFFPRLHFGWSGPMDLFVVSVLIVYEVGWLPMLAGTSVIFVTLPISIFFGRQLAQRRRVTAGCTDRRVRMTNEIFDGILAIKASCWGPSLVKQVASLREDERRSIFKAMLMKSFNESVTFATPYIATAMTFLVYWLQGRELDIAIVFSTMALIHVMRISVGKNLFFFIETFPEALVTVRRIGDFLELHEYERLDDALVGDSDDMSRSIDGKNGTHDHGRERILLKNASFAWGLPRPAPSSKATGSNQVELAEVSQLSASAPSNVLRGINLEARAGEVVLVAGETGCGKSALIQGILGEIRKTGGTVRRAERVAVVEQEPWILAGTFRENVVWASKSFDRRRYQDILARCALEEDVKQFCDGDQTEIGSKGINLSGGQRARVALARACYADADAYLLDDPLSAVDPEVAHHLFHRVVKWLARDQQKAVVLVTHHTNFAPHVDRVLLLRVDGTVDRYCASSEIDERVVSRRLSSDENNEDDDRETEEEVNTKVDDDIHGPTSSKSGEVDEVEELVKKKQVTALVQKEERTIGDVHWNTYLTYLNSGGPILVLVLAILFTGGQTVALMADVSLERWSSQSKEAQEDSVWLQWFFGLTIVAAISGFLRAALFFYVGLKSASTMHTRALHAVVNSPMSFFISNPVGRIINKFSNDLGQVDELLPTTLLACLSGMLLCVGALILSCIAIPWIIIPVLLLGVVLWYVRWYFLKSSRALKRLESITKSPVFVSFNGNLLGRVCIRAFDARDWVERQFEQRLERNGRSWYNWLLVNRWVGFRLDMITWSVLTCVVLAGAYFGSENAIPSGLLAISITYCIQLSGVFQYMVRLSAKVETMMTCVERLDHYCSLPSENDDDESDEGKRSTTLSHVVVENTKTGARNSSWPRQGAVDIKNLCVRYREDLPLVLNDVSVSIPAGSKMGVIGRTGSGKSSLMLALSRLNMVVSGHVLIDDVDVSSLPLSTLRESIGVIPQVPVLFTGTLRRNVDPTNRHDDKAIMRAIEAAHLKSFVRERGGLNAVVAERGSNLSVGQRQCISMARAVLLDRAIYVMDEATGMFVQPYFHSLTTT